MALQRIETLLEQFDLPAEHIADEQKQRDDTTLCGEIIYPSTTDLEEKLLHFRVDRNLSDDREKDDDNNTESDSDTESDNGSTDSDNKSTEEEDGAHASDSDQFALRSTSSDESIKLRFINESDTKIYIFWINYKGNLRLPSHSIAAHKWYQTGSFITHPFLLSRTRKLHRLSDIIAVYIPGDGQFAQHHITVDATRTQLHCSGVAKKPENLARKEWTLDCYERTVIDGFTIYFEVALLRTYQSLLQIVKHDLAVISQCVPGAALKVLRATPIWMNDNYVYYNYRTGDGGGGSAVPTHVPPESMCFHPDAEWLSEHGNLTHKAECVEIYRVGDWIKERGFMPMVLLHELSHSYHWYLSFDREDVVHAYDAVKNSEAKLYQNVPFVLGGTREAYALTNCMEYFAELSEAYFGLNDYYPFCCEELQQYDPTGYQMMQKVWNLNDEQLFAEHQKALQYRREKKKEEENKNKETLLRRLQNEKVNVDASRVMSV